MVLWDRTPRPIHPNLPYTTGTTSPGKPVSRFPGDVPLCRVNCLTPDRRFTNKVRVLFMSLVS